MIKISKLSDYGMIILRYLMRHAGVSLSASQISRETGISHPTVSKILKLLNDSAIVSSQRGVHGGYSLAVQPEHVSLARIMAAIDGELGITECSLSTNECQCCCHPAIKHNWQQLNTLFLHLLENISLEDMAEPMLQTQLLQKFGKLSAVEAAL